MYIFHLVSCISFLYFIKYILSYILWSLHMLLCILLNVFQIYRSCSMDLVPSNFMHIVLPISFHVSHSIQISLYILIHASSLSHIMLCFLFSSHFIHLILTKLLHFFLWIPLHASHFMHPINFISVYASN